MPSNSTEKRIVYYDFIKVIAAFMVCFYHLGLLNLGYFEDNVYHPNINRFFMNFCAASVPLFFMINGALMLRKKYTFEQVLYKFLKIILLYYVWIYIITVLVNYILGTTVKMNFLQFILGGNVYTGYLWFFRTLAILTILTPILYFIRWHSSLILKTILTVLFIFPFLYNFLVVIIKNFNFLGEINLEITGLFTLYSILYFLIGSILSKNEKYNVIYVFLLLFFGWSFIMVEILLESNYNQIIYDGVNSNFPTIGALSLSSGIFLLFSRISFSNNSTITKIITMISDNIMGVYIFHSIFTYFFQFHIKININLIQSILLTSFIIVVCALMTKLLKKINIFKFLLTI